MRRKASMIVLAVLMAAGAIWTAVYDICLSKIKTVSPILNAAVDKTGVTYWFQHGTASNAGESYDFIFDKGTWMIMFDGQAGAVGAGNDYVINNKDAFGQGARCIAFYKCTKDNDIMTVQIGVGGGKSGASDGSRDGGGKTIVSTNFAKPIGFDGAGVEQAIASGGGGGSFVGYVKTYGVPFEKLARVTDGTFKGWEGTDWWDTYYKVYYGVDHQGMPATQNHGGYSGQYGHDTYGYPSSVPGRAGMEVTPNAIENGYGGGDGYYAGGCGCHYGTLGGGGSCSPNCYPLLSSDCDNGFLCNRVNTMGTSDVGRVTFFRIDPTSMPGNNIVVNYDGLNGESIGLVGGSQPGTSGDNRYAPKDAVYAQLKNETWTGGIYDCGIEAKWVYSVRVGGEWEGLAPDGERSETSGTT